MSIGKLYEATMGLEHLLLVSCASNKKHEQVKRLRELLPSY
jgi:hypothetical protein